MNGDPFQGLDQRLYATADQPTSQQANKPASLPVEQPASRPHSQPTDRPAMQKRNQPRRNTSRQAALPEPRVPEKHTYDIYEDQARWMNRLKLEMDEQFRAQLTSNGIVQLAIDVLRRDHEENGNHSILVTALVRGEPWKRIQALIGTEGDT